MTDDDLSLREEVALRRAMDELARAVQCPVGDVVGLVDRGRRARRRRRATLGCAVGGVAIAAVLVAVSVVPKPDAAVVQSSSSTTAGLAPLALKPRPEDHTDQRGLPLPQPAHPMVGTSYPYNWFAHCGMVYITFGGKTWKVDHPVVVPSMHPDANGVTWGPPIIPGYVTPISSTGIRFDAPTYITAVPLHLTTDEVPTCS